MRTLLDLWARLEGLGDREALIWRTAYRRREASYGDIVRGASAWAAELERRGVGPGERVLLWGENRPEWLMAFWGCLLRGVAAVPVDFRSTPDLAQRILDQASPRLALCGDEVDAGAMPRDRTLALGDLHGLESPARFEPYPAGPDDVVEIVFTSGSTSEPKGVVHRHGNIAANLHGVAAEIDRYRWAIRPFQPLRILDLLPFSHLFGQTMGVYIPPLLGGSVVITSDWGGDGLLEILREERVSALVGVPAMLTSLRERIAREIDGPPQPPSRKGWPAIPEIWWRYRRVHRLTGWKFWAFVVGGAALDVDLEQFWRRLGYSVIQGYGLTEASPVVSLNHPLSTKPGCLGKPLPGQQVRIAPDGEILVRGPSVASEYYGGAKGSEGGTRFAGGWLHTGDLGELDEKGRLYYRGRKRDRIVRPDGLNVYPGDVEKALQAEPEVGECVVVDSGEGRVHAALVLPDGAEPGPIVQRVNQRLESHQRIQEWSVWTAEELPRTASTWKIKRGELVELLARRRGDDPPPPDSPLANLLGRELPEASDDLLLSEDLGVSSLERIELQARVEESSGRRLDEERVAALRTVGDLRRLTRDAAAAGPEPSAKLPSPMLLEPRWTRSLPVRGFRRLALDAAILPLSGLLLRPFRVTGAEHLDELEGGRAIFAANHCSHFDTAAVYMALPKRRRHRIAPAMSQEFFRSVFDPRGAGLRLRAEEMAQYLAALGLFNAFPLPQKMSGVRRALRYAGELADDGYDILIYPEGTRSSDGAITRYLPGVGLLAQELALPIVPVRLDGLFRVYSQFDEQPRRGPVSVAFGRPLRFAPQTHPDRIAERVREEALLLPGLDAASEADGSNSPS